MNLRAQKIAMMLLLTLASAFQPGPHTPATTSLRVAVGDTVPLDGEFMIIGDGPTPLKAADVFSGKTVALFTIPGALTPTCTEKQLPGYVAKADDFKAKGVDTVACLSVNDPFVMNEMQKLQDPDGKVTMLGDGAAKFVEAMDIGVDTGSFGGMRSQRASFLIKDGKVEVANLEGGTGFTDASAADTLLSQV